MGLSVRDFVVESKGHCFFCLNDMTPGSQNENKISFQSIQYLSRYLKLDMRKIFKGSVPPYLLAKVDRSKLKVELCSECSSLNAKFSELFQQREKIEMEMDFRLNAISDRLNNCRKLDKQNQFGKQDIPQALREEANKKCILKLNASFPKVKIEKMNWKKPVWEIKKEEDSNIADDFILPDIEFGENFETSPVLEQESSDFHQNVNDSIDNPILDNTQQSLSLPQPPSSSSSSLIKLSSVSKPAKMKRKLAKSEIKVVSLQTAGVIPPPITSGEDRTSSEFIGNYLVIQNPENGKLKCQICSREYNHRSDFNRHFKSVQMNVEYYCPVESCGGIKFTYRDNYIQHYKDIHLYIRYQCQVCKTNFKRRNDLYRHMRQVHKLNK